jgi:flagellar protein FliS
MDPKELILLLYEEALRQMEGAKQGLLRKDPRKRGEHLGRAVAVVSELNSSLASDVDDESIHFLRGLYGAILTELPKVSVTEDAGILDRAMAYIARLKEIWEQDVMKRGGEESLQKPSQQPAESSEPQSRKTAPGEEGFAPARAYGGAGVHRRMAISV